MPAVRITDDGVEWDELVNVKVHPAANLFPVGDTTYLTELTRDIRDHGVHRALVFTPDGQLLEGRGRWIACQRAGVKPARHIERENPWIYVLRRNAATIAKMTMNERAMLLGAIPRRARGNSRDQDLVPNGREVTRLLGLTVGQAGRAIEVCRHGVPELREFTRQGFITVTTAARIAYEDPDTQRKMVARLKRGEHPGTVIPAEQRPAVPNTPRPPGATPRDATLTRAAVEKLIDQGAAVKTLLDCTDGLDPTIDPDEAAALLKKLQATMSGYRKVAKRLTERKELNS